MLVFRILVMSLFLVSLTSITILVETALRSGESSPPHHLPLQVIDLSYGKTVHVVGSCAPDTWKSRTFTFHPNQYIDIRKYLTLAAEAMDWPGITRIQICRTSRH